MCSVDVGELSAKKDKLRGVVNPGENDDQGTGCAESGTDTASTQIQPDSELSEIE